MTDENKSTEFAGWHNRETYMALVKIDNERELHTALNLILREARKKQGGDFDRLRATAKRMRETFDKVHREYGGKVRWYELAGWLLENRLQDLEDE